MPLRRKSNFHRKLIIWAILVAIAVLMIIYFPPNQTMIEIELFP